ncbi:permease [Paenibacillus glycinis]|uniref:Permease n=1 Tax=Paenibacillus glycinis TaxID=2697035 RepID=A0ABW9XNA7_9BACL|nr:permease [Paenibacillus glycinis]NBD24128.1 permease [Paenibacillus glycinis]
MNTEVHERRSHWKVNLVFGFIFGAVLIAFLKPELLGNLAFPDLSGLGTFKTMFVGIVLEALPFILLSVFVSSLMHEFLPEGWIGKVIPRNPLLGIAVAGLLGVVFPVCECGLIPIVRRLIAKGMPLYAGIVFILVGPIVNPVVYGATYTAFRTRPELLYGRMGLALGVGLAVGLSVYVLVRGDQLRNGSRGGDAAGTNQRELGEPVHRLDHDRDEDPAHRHQEHILQHHRFHRDQIHRHQHRDPAHRPNHNADNSDNYSNNPSHNHRHNHSHDHEHSHNHPAHKRNRFFAVLNHAGGELYDMGGYLIFGAAIAAAVQAFLPRAELAGIGQSGWESHLFMMGFAFVLSLCSTSDAFVASSFASTFSAGSLLAFLVFGPMMNLKGLLMLLTAFKARFVILVVLITGAAVLAGSLILAQAYGL